MNKEPLIYLASPYTHVDDTLRHQRYVVISNVAGRLLLQGKMLFAPISQSHPIAEYTPELKTTAWADWMHIDLTMLVRCDQLWVCTMVGWDESTGVRGEIVAANYLNIPIFLLDPVTLSSCVMTDSQIEFFLGEERPGDREARDMALNVWNLKLGK